MPNPVMLDVLIAMSEEEWSGPEQMLGRNQTDHSYRVLYRGIVIPEAGAVSVTN